MPVAALPLIAALTPAPHSITLIDENVTPIDFERCARADIVGVTGMIVQRRRMSAILGRLKERGVYTVVGGPWVSVSETYFDGLADVVFVGEAEQTWPRFLEDWQTGTATARYQQDERTDMTTVPLPRFDLVDMRHYAFASLQFSRGCPFRSEFCDIIVVFGRRPRIKNPDQVVAELDALRATGARIVFVVDDNLVGNKTAIKPVLQAVVDWQVDKGYPLTLFTEASLDLAEDEELMRLMVDANIRSVFVGIETPNEASLRETKKLQNIRPGVSMVERIHAIQRAGMEVWSGMIIGFDSDDATIFDAQRRFVRDARIVSAMVGMLQAIPSTPLYDRLDAVDRLDHADEPAFGTNVIPKQLGRAELQAGYLDIVQALSEPNSFLIGRTRSTSTVALANKAALAAMDANAPAPGVRKSSVPCASAGFVRTPNDSGPGSGATTRISPPHLQIPATPRSSEHAVPLRRSLCDALPRLCFSSPHGVGRSRLR